MWRGKNERGHAGWGAEQEYFAGDRAGLSAKLDYVLHDDVAEAMSYYRSVPAPGEAQEGRVRAPSPTSAQEVSFLNGLNPNGTLTDQSYWGFADTTAFKWGDPVLGTGATISYSFQTSSRLTDVEKATILKAFGLWSSVANVTFVEVASNSAADVLIRRGNDGSAYASTPTSDGSGSTPGSVTGQALISVDTSTPGFDLSGSFDRAAGYGLSTIIHEVGHMLGLGHGGFYNGSATPRTDQFSAFDNRMYTIMSYIGWDDTDAKFRNQNPVTGTNWGSSADGSTRNAPHTMMVLDILAIQQLYGAAVNTPLDGGQTYGFHSNIEGTIGDFFDFSVNSSPVVTIYNQGNNNTIDLTEYFVGNLLDLRPGAFSSVGGLSNNLTIALGTNITTGITGAGNDTLVANDLRGVLSAGGGNDLLLGGAGGDELRGDGGVDTLVGNGGKDLLTGGSGADLFVFTRTTDSNKAALKSDVITDFNRVEGDRIDLSVIDAIKGGANDAFRLIGTSAFSGNAGELRIQFVDGDVLVSGDVNGDRKADFMIRLEDVTTVGSTDFIL